MSQETKRQFPSVLLGKDKKFQNFCAVDPHNKIFAATFYKQRDREGNIINDADPIMVSVSLAASATVSKIKPLINELGIECKPQFRASAILLTGKCDQMGDHSQVFLCKSEDGTSVYARDINLPSKEILVQEDTVFETNGRRHSFLFMGGAQNYFALLIQGKASKRLIFPNVGSGIEIDPDLTGNTIKHGIDFIKAIWPELGIYRNFKDNANKITINQDFVFDDSVKYVQYDRINSVTCPDGSLNDRKDIVVATPFGVAI